MASPELIRNELDAELIGLSRGERLAALQDAWIEGNRKIAEAYDDPATADWDSLEPVHTRTEHAARLITRMGAKPARCCEELAA